MTNYYYDNYTAAQNRFENQSVSFKQFSEITEEDYKRIKDLATTFLKNRTETKRLALYIDAINFVTTPKSHVLFKNFDEKALFLILAVDKNILAFKTYLKTPSATIIPTEYISLDKQKRIVFNSMNNQKYQNKIREELGFYNRLLLIIEQAYFRRFLSSQIHLSNIQKNYHNNFFKSINYIKNFNDITEEDYERIKESVASWLNEIGQNPNVDTIIFSIIEQSDTLKLKNIKEQYLFLIMTLDPEFKMLKIYTDESRLDVIEKRCIEEFGFFNIKLIKLEMEYHKKFKSDVFISEWYENKKKL